MANFDVDAGSGYCPIGLDAPVLITGAEGFIGKNLVARLTALGYTNLMRYDISTPKETLKEYAANAAFVYHLAGINRPKSADDFYTGNSGLTQELLGLLQSSGNKAPVLLSSSTQVGNGTDYAISKAQAEQALEQHGINNQSPVYLFRLPGVFGKWCRPSYNSVVATFCHNIAHGLPIEIHDGSHKLNICYIDDVVDIFLSALAGTPAAPVIDGCFGISPTYNPSLGELAAAIEGFANTRSSLEAPDVGDDFTRKLYATYLSYLPEQGAAYKLEMKKDERGSFTEFLRSEKTGQVSVNVAKPGVVKGNHWHDTKNEKFLVVSGSAVIRQRKLGSSQIDEYNVSGEDLTVVDILPGYTHNIENTGKGDLVTLMWASEPFNPERPDTYFLKV